MAIQDDLSDTHAPIRAVMRRIEILERTGPKPDAAVPGQAITFETGPERDFQLFYAENYGTAIDVTSDVTVNSAQVRMEPRQGAEYHLECWSMNGTSLVARVGSPTSVTCTAPSSRDPIWLEFPPVQWPLRPGNRYGFIVVWTFVPDHYGVGWNWGVDMEVEHLDIPGVGVAPWEVSYIACDGPPAPGVVMRDYLDDPENWRTRPMFVFGAEVAGMDAGPVAPAQISTAGASEGQVLKIVGGVATWVTP